MIDWLRKNKESLSLRGIERQLKMPDTTLVKAVNGSQKLAKHWEEPLGKFIDDLNTIANSKPNKSQLSEAWHHGAVRVPRNLKHLNNFDDYYEVRYGGND